MKKHSNFWNQSILNLDGSSDELTLYYVHFYGDPIPIPVRASNTSTAEILAAATRIHEIKSFGVRMVVNSITGNYVPSILKNDL
jgi:hypothetical protein